MLTYSPGDSLAHRLDPRTKLLLQITFVASAVAHTTPRGLAVLTGLTAVLLGLSRLSPTTALWEFRYALPLLVVGPLVAGATLGAPWFVVSEARETSLASYRVLLVLLVSAAYVRTTAPRDSRAAIQRSVPGKPGQFLGMGVGLVFRFLPLLQSDLARTREAIAARLGEERPVHERMELVATAGLNRAFQRADTLGLAMQARCLSWNPTLPPLRFTRLDAPAVALAAVLAVSVLF
ncbi:biotin transport system permease protein [Halogranum gelatinilyticum]|uniref:Biotin transport system permease protein n=1 Tax=Halogranum gelatinilyticum TaxID=660521 RepID=A0A1G9PGZ1_9EURY|nr:energy-coupling factor transporter transmembrane protein EcfT [Halogranum gelatinilyticum]SDL97994.1 biotin transport system permease protein [Halogranum gelatinilyticum]